MIGGQVDAFAFTLVYARNVKNLVVECNEDWACYKMAIHIVSKCLYVSISETDTQKCISV